MEPNFPISVLPPVIGVDELAVILGRKKERIQADFSQRPWSLPPWVAIPGGRKRWITEDVFSWLRNQKIDQADIQSKPPGRKRGRPTKAEQLRRAQQGLIGGGR